MWLFMSCPTSKKLYILTDSLADKTKNATEKSADLKFYANTDLWYSNTIFKLCICLNEVKTYFKSFASLIILLDR